jgi:UDP-N-acetylmuramoyl-tripeptide--D-alanyl-D-alanine ligase
MNTNIQELYQLFLQHPQVSIDSRKCAAGSLFFALRGENFDGNRFAATALSAGAGYAVIDNADYYLDERTIMVDNTLEALQRLAQTHRKALGLPVIGITGTNGKTTTKELLAATLAVKFNLLYTEGNLNNHIGLPLTLLRLKREHEMAVVEMGASHTGEIAALTEIAQPDYGIVTNVGRAHLEGFGSFENVVKTKSELYDYIRRTNGVAFMRKEDRVLQSIAGEIRRATYSTESGEAFVSGAATAGRPFLSFNWEQYGKTYFVETQLVGSYNVCNAMAAVAVGRYFDIPAESINHAIASYKPSNNRSQLTVTPYNSLIIDAYNANPDSMKAALDNFASMPASPKAVILGDMKELGSDSQRLHIEIAGEVEAARFDKVFLCGEEFAKAARDSGLPSYPSAEALLESLRQSPLKGFHILIKGSRGMEMEKVAEVL